MSETKSELTIRRVDDGEEMVSCRLFDIGDRNHRNFLLSPMTFRRASVMGFFGEN